MIKSKRFNNLSDKLVPVLKRDEVVHFRYAHITTDPSGIPIYPTYYVPSTDTIWDKEKGEFVEIAYITSPPAGDRPESIGTIVLQKSEKCVITLSGKNPQDVLKYQYMKLCNYNGSNPNRDETKMLLFEEISSAAGHESTVSKAKEDFALSNLALNSSIDEYLLRLPD